MSERGHYDGHVAETSVYTQAALHPWLTTAIVGAFAGIAFVGLIGSKHRRPASRGQGIVAAARRQLAMR